MEAVHSCWQHVSGGDLLTRLEGCAEDLKKWSKSHCNKLKIDIEDCRKKLLRFRGTNDMRHYEGLQRRMTHLLLQEDAYWRQRAKTHWYKDGDLNTKFFHASATARKKVNRITYLENNDGVRVTDEVGMANMAKEYFHELFQAKESVTTLVLNVLRQVIIADDNIQLTVPFWIEEFKEAMFSMQPDKCPGPDGFNPGFYQHFWRLCSPDIFQECVSWLTQSQISASLNATNIALIPKGTEQRSMKDWRPIALCNVLYKLLSKVLATG